VLRVTLSRDNLDETGSDMQRLSALRYRSLSRCAPTKPLVRAGRGLADLLGGQRADIGADLRVENMLDAAQPARAPDNRRVLSGIVPVNVVSAASNLARFPAPEQIARFILRYGVL